MPALPRKHTNNSHCAVWIYNNEVDQMSDYTTSGGIATKGIIMVSTVTSAAKGVYNKKG